MTNIDLSGLELCSCKTQGMRKGLNFGQPRASSHSKAQRKTLETTAVTPITRKKNFNKTVIHSCIGCFFELVNFLNK